MNRAILPLSLHKFMAYTCTSLLFSFVTNIFTPININRIKLQKPTETHAGLLGFIRNSRVSVNSFNKTKKMH